MNCITINQLNLMNRMNTLWEQHVFWTRLLIISILNDLGNLEETQNRLLKNPIYIGMLFGRFYGPNVQNIITELLTEHLVVGAQLITTYKNNITEDITRLDKQWYENADKMAKAFASINPHYDENVIRMMLYSHLDLTKKEVALNLEGKFAEDIENFNMIEKQALEMAQYFSMGIVKQFGRMFTCYLY